MQTAKKSKESITFSVNQNEQKWRKCRISNPLLCRVSAGILLQLFYLNKCPFS